MARNTTQITPSTGDAAMRAIKNFWVASGRWQVIASGDGDGLYGAAGDLDPDVIDNDSGVGSFANYTVATKNAWCRLRMVGTTRELLIERGSASTTWWIRYSLTGFSGGSPSATVAPTATDQQNVHGTAITGSQLFPTDGTYQVSICAEDASPSYAAASWRLTGGAPTAQGILGVLPLKTGSYPTTPTADADPYVCFAGYANGVTGSNFTGANAASNFSRSWSRPGLGGATWCAAMLGLDANNATGSTHAINSYELAPEVSAQMATAGPTYYGPKGILRDVRAALSSTTVSPNGTYLVDGSDYFMRWGPLWLRWGTTPST